jgi:hypothetical protein
MPQHLYVSIATEQAGQRQRKRVVAQFIDDGGVCG